MTELNEQISGHVPRIYRVALRMAADVDCAQDVVQDVCVKALRSLDSFDGRSSLATWLHTITMNCARDHLRVHQRTAERGKALGTDDLDMLAVLDRTPDIDAQQRELYTLAAAMVSQLPDDCRSAFILTQLDGYSYDEAAGIEGLSRGTMASRVFRAKKLLLAKLTGPRGRRDLS